MPDVLRDFLNVIHRWGGSITTYPGRDATQQAIYQTCRDLECCGQLRRVWQRNDTDGAVVLFKRVDVSGK